MTTVAAARAAARERLAAAGVETPDVDARVLVATALDTSESQLWRWAQRPLPASAAARLAAMVRRRADREPLQIVVGRWPFRHVDLEMAPAVFVPRPETEVLAGLAIGSAPPGGRVVETCTGSGAVAAALADERPDLHIVATDVDPAAVALARRNAPSVDVRCGDLLAPVPTAWRGSVDVLVANPPYIAESEVGTLPPEVAAHDPLRALVSGPSGHEVSDRLIEAACRWLAPGGWLMMETDTSRAVESARRAAAAGLVDARCEPDLTGRPRFVVAARPR